MRVLSWIFAAALFAVGCGGQLLIINGVEVRETYWNEAVKSLEGRASFELQCPTTSLEFLLLARAGRHPSEIAVTGCGKRAMYVRSVVHGSLTEWKLSGASGTAPSAPPPALTPPPLPPPASPSQPTSSTGNP